jgi:hypothetical protein
MHEVYLLITRFDLNVDLFQLNKMCFIYHLIYIPLLALVALVLFLASIGAQLGIREMYVKALLRVFDYATKIKAEKESCEELVENGNLFYLM